MTTKQHFNFSVPTFRKVIVSVPASIANLGPGFDVFSIALENPYDRVTITSISSGVKIKVNGYQDCIPSDPSKNTAGVVAKHMLNEFSLNSGVLIEIDKRIPPGVGLGSSAASAVAVAFGLNKMFNLKLSYEQLVYLSAKGEVASAGFEHADNVSAAIYGGFVIVKSYKPLEIIHLKTPSNMVVCVAIPKISTPPKKTEKARAILPSMIPIEKLVYNVGHAASMAVGFVLGDVKLIGRSMCDGVIEPVRASMIPGYQLVKDAAIKAGACGVAISGAGPSMIAIVDEKDSVSSEVMEAMKQGFKKAGIDAEVFLTKPGKGASLLEVE